MQGLGTHHEYSYRRRSWLCREHYYHTTEGQSYVWSRRPRNFLQYHIRKASQPHTAALLSKLAG